MANNGSIHKREWKWQLFPLHTSSLQQPCYATASLPCSTAAQHLNNTSWIVSRRQPAGSLVPLSPFCWRPSTVTVCAEPLITLSHARFELTWMPKGTLSACNFTSCFIYFISRLFSGLLWFSCCTALGAGEKQHLSNLLCMHMHEKITLK